MIGLLFYVLCEVVKAELANIAKAEAQAGRALDLEARADRLTTAIVVHGRIGLLPLGSGVHSAIAERLEEMIVKLAAPEGAERVRAMLECLNMLSAELAGLREMVKGGAEPFAEELERLALRARRGEMGEPSLTPLLETLYASAFDFSAKVIRAMPEAPEPDENEPGESNGRGGPLPC